MSFQHFRLGDLPIGQPLPSHLIQHHIPQPHTQFQQQNIQASSAPTASSSSAKQPYGSGDQEDGYTLVFANLDAFQAWRQHEEETQMVEFVKGDTHGSKAIPPRFKDHTKLVCARHSRSGRKKYVKKHPERVRKVPSRKLEGQGCSASISYKTYFDTDEVRACYISQHSHEIGVANLPFTRRGRKAAVQQEKEDTKRFRAVDGSPTAPSVSSNPDTVSAGNPNYNSAVSMLAPLPPNQSSTHFNQLLQQPFGQTLPQEDRWDRMSVLYGSIRDHVRGGFEYPGPSVAALESVLIRLYLESPVGSVLMGGNTGGGIPQVNPQTIQGAPNGNGNNVADMNGVTS